MPVDRTPGPCSIRTCLAAWLVLGAGVALAAAPDRPPELTDYRVVRWTTAQGLPQNTVNDIVILPDGEMWVATFGGLARFDGNAFKVLDIATDEGLPANRIVALAREQGQSFLFLTQQGHLGRVTNGRPTLLVPPPDVSVDFLDMVVRSAGDVYARSAPGGVWHTDLVHGWQRVLGGRGERVINSLVTDSTSAIWSLWQERIAGVDPPTPGLDIPGKTGRVAVRRPDGGLWVATAFTLLSFDAGRLTPLDVTPAFDQGINVMDPVDEDHLWVAAGSEVSLVERQPDGTWRRSRLPVEMPPGFHGVSLYRERDGTLWIGSDGGGLYRANRTPALRYGDQVGVHGVGGLASDGGDGLLIASGCVSLVHLDGAGQPRPVFFRAIVGRLPLPACGVSFAPGPSGTVWARAGHFLLRYRNGARDGELVTGGLPHEEGPIASARDGTVWVLSRGGLVQHLSAAGAVIRQLTLPGPLMVSEMGPDGSVWAGGDGALFRVGAHDVTAFRGRDGMLRGLVRAIVPEPDGGVWVGTYGGGVGRLRNGDFARLTVDQGLPDNSVSGILIDRSDRMWIATNRGVAVVPRQLMNEVADGRRRDVSPVVLGPERGIPEANYGSPAIAMDAAGRIWFGTIDGAVAIDPASFPGDTKPLATRIDEVRADEHVLRPGLVVTVPALTKRLRIDYTAFELLYPERIRFRYRIDGAGDGWIDAGGDRHIEWTPTPGRHELFIQARNRDGLWSSTPAALTLDVLPAWWQTAAFRAALGLMMVLVALAAVRFRVRHIERRHARQLRILDEQRMAEERLGSMRMQLERVSRAALAGELAASIAHEVRQPIGAIVNNAEAGRRQLSNYLRNPPDLDVLFSDIVADAMRASEVIQGLRGFLQPRGPESSLIDLSALVREVLPLVRRELHDNEVRVALMLADHLPPVEGLRVQLGQIVVNLVTNACEALAGAPGERRVIIATMVRDGRLELSVCDNGPGLRPDVAARVFEPFVTTKVDGLGVGLAVCRSIAERHGGRLTVATPDGGGLCMTLTLPPIPAPGGSS